MKKVLLVVVLFVLLLSVIVANAEPGAWTDPGTGSNPALTPSQQYQEDQYNKWQSEIRRRRMIPGASESAPTTICKSGWYNSHGVWTCGRQ